MPYVPHMATSDPIVALTYATYRQPADAQHPNGKVLVLRTDLRSRVFMMASILNKLYAKGYQDDMIDWYRVTTLLQVHNAQDVKPPVTIVTSLKDFKQLYTWADESNVRSITFTPIAGNGEVAGKFVLSGRSSTYPRAQTISWEVTHSNAG